MLFDSSCIHFEQNRDFCVFCRGTRSYSMSPQNGLRNGTLSAAEYCICSVYVRQCVCVCVCARARLCPRVLGDCSVFCLTAVCLSGRVWLDLNWVFPDWPVVFAWFVSCCHVYCWTSRQPRYRTWWTAAGRGNFVTTEWTCAVPTIQSECNWPVHLSYNPPPSTHTHTYTHTPYRPYCDSNDQLNEA